MTDYLLDSDVIIWCLRGKGEAIAFVRSLASNGLPACSALSVLEVELGMKPGEEEKTNSFLNSLKVISVTKETARLAGHYIRACKKRGRHCDFVDAVIAASCVLEEMTLVTYNIKHYPMTELVKISPVSHPS